MFQIQKWLREKRILSLLLFGTIFIVVFFHYYWLPIEKITKLKVPDNEQVKLANDARNTFAAALSGLFFLMTAIASFLNFISTNEKQITERFSNAITQLGSPEIHIRIGSIYALERIAKDSEKDYWQIMEILTTYVRDKSPYPQKKKKPSFLPTQEDNGSEDIPSLSIDIQAVLTVLGRRKKSFGNGEEYQLDISKSNLKKLKYDGTGNYFKIKPSFKQIVDWVLLSAYTIGTLLLVSPFVNLNILREIYVLILIVILNFTSFGYHILFNQISLITSIKRANFKAFNFYKTNLQEANLMGANLQEANLQEANLQEANLQGTDLQQAKLQKANLQKANLKGAELIGANFRSANLEGASLEETFLIATNFQEANLEKANLQGSDCLNANFEGANLQEANFEKAINLKQEQVKAAKHWDKAKYDSKFCKKLGLLPKDTKIQ